MTAQRLRDAARGMREKFQPQGEYAFCQCEESDHWFDRSICPEPCGSMHNICVDCGRIKGYCAVAVTGRENGDRLARSWLAVADWLDSEVAAWEYRENSLGAISIRAMSGGTNDVDPHALAVADAFLGQAEGATR